PANGLGRALLNVPSMINQIKRTSHEQGQRSLAGFSAAASVAGVPLSHGVIHTMAERFGTAIADHGRYHDMTLLNWSTEHNPLKDLADPVLFTSGRPVAIVPENVAASGLETIFIAWDGSAVAARAVGGAEPLLAKASHVVIGTVVDEKHLDEPN